MAFSRFSSSLQILCLLLWSDWGRWRLVNQALFRGANARREGGAYLRGNQAGTLHRQGKEIPCWWGVLAAWHQGGKGTATIAIKVPLAASELAGSLVIIAPCLPNSVSNQETLIQLEIPLFFWIRAEEGQKKHKEKGGGARGGGTVWNTPRKQRAHHLPL
jgi:hypothetical protein